MGMTRPVKLKRASALIVALSLVMSVPMSALASDGKKHFKEGMKYEQNKQWDKAAEQYALAIAESPSNSEYGLFYQRALVNAAIMLVERGDAFAEQKDYNAAYQTYRKAYSFDPTNELAQLKMRRMLEVQGISTDNLPKVGDPSGPSYKPRTSDNTVRTSASTTSSNGPTAAPTGNAAADTQKPGIARTHMGGEIPSRRLPRRDVVYRSINLGAAIEELAQAMRLNVVFDQQAHQIVRNNNTFSITLHDVSPAKALEIILTSNNLMYSQLDSRTLIIATDNPQTRMKYEEQSVRTFYLKNADPTEVRQVVQATLGTKQVVPSKQLNALVIRDTPPNLQIIESLINSLDKSKAEVLIDVNLYEVSRNDLIQIGNQFSTDGSKQSVGFTDLGGIGRAGILGLGPRTLTGPFGIALGLPTSSLSLFQDKGKAKLLSSTQVHVLDNEQHQIRIGQRVPIQTASLPFVGGQTPTSNTNRAVQAATGGNGVATADSLLGSSFGFSGIPQIQYQDVGLNIDLTPNVYEDDVQMKMKIETSSIDSSTGVLTPTFNQRTMQSVARIRDGQTTMVAGVSSTEQSKEVKGLPIIGLIPILGRLFSTPQTKDRQSDVIITVTPHILRRADIREEDHLARNIGPESNLKHQLDIEQILYLADQEEIQQKPVASAPAAADKDKLLTSSEQTRNLVSQSTTANPAVNAAVTPGVVVIQQPAVPIQQTNFQPAGQQVNANSGATPNTQPAGKAPGQTQAKKDPKELDDDDDDDTPPTATQFHGPVTVSVTNARVAAKGQTFYAAIIVNGDASISGADISLSFDANILDVQSVRDGGLLRCEPQFTSTGGIISVHMEKPAGTGGSPARGQLLFIMFSVKGQGSTALTLNEQTTMRTPNGMVVPLKTVSSQVDVR